MCRLENAAVSMTPPRRRLSRKSTPKKENSLRWANPSRQLFLGESDNTTPPPTKRPRIELTAVSLPAPVSAELTPPPTKRPRIETTAISLPAPVSAKLTLPPIRRPDSTEFDAEALPLAAVYPLIGRERECGELDSFLDCRLHRHIVGGVQSFGSLYVSGGPGTGKTCSVRAAVAAWGRDKQNTSAKVFEVNCMDLSQRTVSSLLCHLGDKVGVRRSGMTGQNLVAAVARGLAMLGGPIVIIVDEVDQLVGGGPRAAAGPLPTLFSLPHVPGAPPIALFAIANAVDLLDRTLPAANLGCRTLLFEPYTAPQLKQIVQAKFAAEGASGSAMGGIAFEMGLRRAAKQSGDCRRAISLCEQALFAETKAREERELELRSPATGDVAVVESQYTLDVSKTVPSFAPVVLAERVPKVAPSPLKFGKSASLDPIGMIADLPLGQQVLLCALASSQTAASRSKDLCRRYKDYCRLLHQPLDLASRAQMSAALSALEQQGLISLRAPPGSAARKGAMSGGAAGDCVAELTLSCEVVRTNVVKATPVLQRCFQ